MYSLRYRYCWNGFTDTVSGKMYPYQCKRWYRHCRNLTKDPDTSEIYQKIQIPQKFTKRSRYRRNALHIFRCWRNLLTDTNIVMMYPQIIIPRSWALLFHTLTVVYKLIHRLQNFQLFSYHLYIITSLPMLKLGQMITDHKFLWQCLECWILKMKMLFILRTFSLFRLQHYSITVQYYFAVFDFLEQCKIIDCQPVRERDLSTNVKIVW